MHFTVNENYVRHVDSADLKRRRVKVLLLHLLVNVDQAALKIQLEFVCRPSLCGKTKSGLGLFFTHCRLSMEVSFIANLRYLLTVANEIGRNLWNFLCKFTSFLLPI